MDQIKSLRGCFVCVVSVCGLFSVGEHWVVASTTTLTIDQISKSSREPWAICNPFAGSPPFYYSDSFWLHELV
jgi:hypothetical protein